VDGWSGAGYIITDPRTGSGAYKISGGVNGGEVASVAANTVLQLRITINSLVAQGDAYTRFLGPLSAVANGIVTLIDLWQNCNSLAAKIALTIYLVFVVSAITALFATFVVSSTATAGAASLIVLSPPFQVALSLILSLGLDMAIGNLREQFNC